MVDQIKATSQHTRRIAHRPWTCSGIQGGGPARDIPFCWFYVLGKCWKPVFPWLFLILRDKWKGVRVILQKRPWKTLNMKCGYYTTHGYLMCNTFWAPYYLNIPMWFLVWNVFGQIWPSVSYMWRVLLHH